jgi:hypothetical protein
MVTRIKYHKQLESWFSKQLYISANKYVKVMIDYDFCLYIFDNNNSKLCEIPCKSLAGAKRKARQQLIEYGVKFGYEARGKRK